MDDRTLFDLVVENRQLQAAQMQLEVSRARYVDLYDLAPVAYFTFDELAVVREANRAGAEIFGRPRDLVVGRPIFALAEFDEPQQFNEHLRQAISASSAVTSDLCFRVCGRLAQVEATSAVIRNRPVSVLSFRTAFVDVSARELAKQNARDAYVREQRLRDRLEQIDEALHAMQNMIASPTADDDAVYELVVEKARAIVRADSLALGIGERPDEFFARWVIAAPGAAPRTEGPCASSAAGVLGQVLCASRTIRLNDCSSLRELRALAPAAAFIGAPLRHVERTFGGVYAARTAARPPFNEDDALALQRFVDRAALLLELALQRRKAVRAVSARDVVLATVSHDLGNPLGSIWMACAELLRDGPLVDTRRTRPLLEIIRRSAGRMQRLIDDLMAVATLESGKLSIDRKRTATCDLLAEASKLFRPLTDSKNQRLELHAPAGLPDVDCDRDRILQVLANLVGNAIKFSPPGSPIRLAAEARDGEVVISVSDAGPGIAPDAFAHIFDRYWRGDRSTRGAGLGLYVAREIISAHDGRIWVEGRAGAGSLFSFALRALASEGPGILATRAAPAREGTLIR